MDLAGDTRVVVLVEGESDRSAVLALARRCGHELEREHVEVVSIGGAHAIGRIVGAVAPGVRVAGLCDAGEVGLFGRALGRGGASFANGALDRERPGLFVCDPDLEGELIRALGAPAVEKVLERSGKLGAFRTFQKQPQWQGRPVEDQLRRFLGSSAGKIRHAPLLAEAIPPDRVPPPLAALLAYVSAAA